MTSAIYELNFRTNDGVLHPIDPLNPMLDPVYVEFCKTNNVTQYDAMSSPDLNPLPGDVEKFAIRNERNILLGYAQKCYDFLESIKNHFDDCDMTKDELNQLLEMAPDKVPYVAHVAEGPTMHPEDEANEELHLVHGNGYEA